jgi:hypothetical protein
MKKKSKNKIRIKLKRNKKFIKGSRKTIRNKKKIEAKK